MAIPREAIATESVADSAALAFEQMKNLGGDQSLSNDGINDSAEEITETSFEHDSFDSEAIRMDVTDDHRVRQVPFVGKMSPRRTNNWAHFKPSAVEETERVGVPPKANHDFKKRHATLIDNSLPAKSLDLIEGDRRLLGFG